MLVKSRLECGRGWKQRQRDLGIFYFFKLLCCRYHAVSWQHSEVGEDKQGDMFAMCFYIHLFECVLYRTEKGCWIRIQVWELVYVDWRRNYLISIPKHKCDRHMWDSARSVCTEWHYAKLCKDLFFIPNENINKKQNYGTSIFNITLKF